MTGFRFKRQGEGIGMTGVAGLLMMVMAMNLPTAVAVIQPGEVAPSFSLAPHGGGETFVLDGKTSAVYLLVFVKPEDRYLDSTLGVLNDLFARQPDLQKRLRKAVIVSRFVEEKEMAGVIKAVDGKWPLLLDRDDCLYHGYKIIATPTIVMVGVDGKVADVHPGYDAGLEQHVRVALSGLLGVELPAYALGQTEKPNMALQMGRRMAQRGLWDKALEYYRQAAEAQPLDALARLELAGIHLELGQFDQFRQILDEISTDSPELIQKKNQLLERAQVLQQQEESGPVPPKVMR